MTNTKLQHDATASTRATLHQFWVAVEKCFEMDKTGQKVLIEKYGDVSGEDQIEVKCYSDKLTDNHVCFWKTLRNWLQADFDPTQYESLILLTTQEFGATASIANWNNETPDKRMQVIQTIYDQNETKHKKTSKDDGNKLIPQSLKFQREVFAAEQGLLRDVLSRFFIEALAQDTPRLHKHIKGRYLKGIYEAKKDHVLNALFGYVSQPENNDVTRWEITYEDFTAEVESIARQFGHGTRIFPRVDVDLSDAALTAHKRDHLFVQKIEDIEYHKAVRKAVEDYQIAVRTVKEEFKTYSVPAERTKRYSQDIVDKYNIEYGKAARNSTNVIRDSQNLYDDIIGSTPQPLPDFDTTPRDFRNGLLHAELDDEDKALKWRLDQNE